MKAFVLRENSFQIEEVKTPECAAHEVLVKLHYAALNHRDEWIRQGQYAKIEHPAILGSDGVGEVVATGGDAGEALLGKTVIINPNINWGDTATHQDMRNYQILGMPSQGTLAEFICVDVDRLVEKPQHLNPASAAALPLAGLTAYNALFNKGELTKDKKVLISGVGGGVAQFAFQFALAEGAKVWVTSSKTDVLDTCVKMGAQDGANYKEENAYQYLKKDSGGFDIIIDSAGGDGLNDLLSTLAPNGKYVFYGATNGIPKNLNLRMIFWKHLSLLGTTMGSDDDFRNMVKFVEDHSIEPIIDKIFPFEKVVEAFDRMKAGDQFGKIVVSIP